MRVSVFRAAICAVALAVAGRAAAQEKPEFKFEFHGFAGGSIYAQDFVANNQGEGAFYATNVPRVDKTQLGADTRQTRLNLSLAGPKVFGGATPKAIVEMDFFGVANVGSISGTTLVTSTNGFTNLTPRARVLAAELKWANTTIQFGQNSDLTLHVTPTSVGHIPQSYTYDAGTLGARHAGFFVWQYIPLVEDYKLELAAQITRSAYDDGSATTGAGVSGTFLSQGEASSIPMVVGRVKLISKIFEVSVTGLYNQVDLNGVGEDAATGAANGTKDVYVGVVAAKASFEGFTVQGSAYYGQNLAQFTPAFGQFSKSSLLDLKDMGGWIQVGYTLPMMPELSFWALGGIERMDPNEIFRLRTAANTGQKGIWGNSVVSGMVRYLEKGYAIGLEYVHFETMYLDVSTPAPSRFEAPNGVLKGNQLMLSGFYFF